MVSGTERARTLMDSIRDSRHRIAAAIQVDRLFETFEIEMAPEEALSFAAMSSEMDAAIAGRMYRLIEKINRIVPPTDFGPAHPRSGRPHHVYRMGRRRGRRLFVLEIFAGFISREHSVDSILDEIRRQCTDDASVLAFDYDETLHRFTFSWDD